MFDFKELFLNQWLKVFASLLEAQISGTEDRNVEKLQARYMRLAELAGPDLLQEFMCEALRRVGETAPDFAERLLRDLTARGVLKDKAASQGEA